MSNENATIGWVDKNKTAMLRKLALVLVLSVQVMSGMGQVYFDELYGDSDAGGGVPSGGTLIHHDNYLIWAGQFQAEWWPSPFIINFSGGIVSSFDWQHNDSIGEQLANVFKLNDTLFVGLSFQTVNSQSSAIIGDMVLTCFMDNGTIIWRRVYGSADRRDIPHMVISTNDKGFVVIGQTKVVLESDTEADLIAMKISHDGNVEWERFYGGSDYESGHSLLQTPDQGFLLLGWTRSFGNGQRDFYLVKTDSLGEQEWQQTYGGSDMETATGIITLSDSNYLLAGAQIIGGVDKGKLIKIQPNGEVIWEKEYLYPGCTASEINKVIELSNGSIIGAGVSDLSGEGNSGWLVKTDSEGNELWQRKYNKNENTDLFYSVLLAEDGGFLLSGQARNAETNSQDAWLLKVDSVGCPYPNCLVGVDEAEPSKVMVDVWPNPTSEVLNLELQQQGVAEIMLYDMAGKLLMQKQTTQQREALDVSALENGLYLLTVLQGDMKTTVKVMVW